MLPSLATKAQRALVTPHPPKQVAIGNSVRRALVGHQRRIRVSVYSEPGANSEVKINIEGMMCDGCSSRIEKVLKGMEAVQAVNVSLEGKVALVQLAKGDANSAEAQAAAAALVDTINNLGFEARLQQ